MCDKTNRPEDGGERVAPVVITEIETCGCTNEALERGGACGQANCPNLNLSEEERAVRRRDFRLGRGVVHESPEGPDRAPLSPPRSGGGVVGMGGYQ